MVTDCCTQLTASELAGVREGVEAAFRHTCTIRRPTAPPAPFTVVAAGVPCLIKLRTGQSHEMITTPSHSDTGSAELLVPVGTDLKANDVVDVNGSRFTVRLIDPDDTACIRALGTVGR